MKMKKVVVRRMPSKAELWADAVSFADYADHNFVLLNHRGRMPVNYSNGF